MAGSTTAPRSDQVLSNKWDFVISNALVKSGIGFGAGVVASVLFFRRRSFPVWLGLGVGAGRAWAEGDAIFRVPIVPTAAPEAGLRNVKA